MARTQNRRRTPRSGFTLIEIIVVVIIIGVLATLIAPRVLDRIGQSKRAVAENNAKSLRTQVDLFYADVGRKPRSGEALRDILLERPSDVGDNWRGPYVNAEDELLDPWGNEYDLVIPGEVHFDYDIVSYGADGKPGGEGDDADIVK